MSDNKYKLFRNYMVNELGIGKDDIKEWTKQAVTETVEKVLRGMDMKEFIMEQAKRLLKDEFGHEWDRKRIIMESVSKVLSEQINVSISLKGGDGA
jgi:hypothetical protein